MTRRTAAPSRPFRRVVPFVLVLGVGVPAGAALALPAPPPAASLPPAERRLDGVVSGTVTTVEGRPLPSAQVRLSGGSLPAPLATLSGHDGRFVVPRVPPGSYTLTVTYVGYRPARESVQVADGATASVTVRLQAATVQLGAVRVLGTITAGQAKALTEQKNAASVANVVSQEQIQRFPDRNAAEAVQRIPGISVQREEGEGELVQIRGLGAELNAVTINGQRAPSANPRFGEQANQRATSLETIQADIVQAVRVNKALTPDLDADAIGGQIDFRLATAPTRGRAEFEAGYGPANAPDRVRAPGYGDGIGNARATLGRRFASDRLGILLNGSYFRNDRRTVMEQDYFVANTPDSAGFTDVNRVRREDRDFSRERYGLVGSADYRFDARHELRFAVTGNRFSSDEIRRRVDFRAGSNGQNDNFVRNHEEARWLGTADLSGEHGLGPATLRWSGAFGRGEEEQPDRAVFNYRRSVPELRTATTEQFRALTLQQEFASVPRYTLRFVERTPVFHREDTRQGRLDLSVPLRVGARTHDVAVGVKHLRRDKLFEPRYFQQRPATGQTITLLNGVFDGVQGVRPGTSGYAALPLRRTSAGADSLEEDRTRGRYTEYDADEDISAAYAMGTLQLGRRLSALVGARVERTDIRMRTLEPRAGSTTAFDTVRTPREYTNVLPSAHLTWRATDASNVRLAYSSGLARPDYFALVDSRFVNEDADSILGNPRLRPTTARNLDLLYEVYGSDVSFFSAGAFAKLLTDPIARTRRPYTRQDDVVIQSINGERAEIYGVELAANYRLTRLPEALRLLRPFGVYATYSFARTAARYDLGSRVTAAGDTTDFVRSLPFINSPRHTANLALTYDDPRHGVQFTASGNYRGSRLDEIGVSDLTDVYYRDETTVDLSAAWRVLRGTELVLRANNLLDTPERRTLGDPSASFARQRFRETYGRSVSLGARYVY